MIIIYDYIIIYDFLQMLMQFIYAISVQIARLDFKVIVKPIFKVLMVVECNSMRWWKS